MKIHFSFFVLFACVSVACRAHDQSRVASVASEQATSEVSTKASKSFRGKSGEASCSLTITWNMFGVTELTIKGPHLKDFMLAGAKSEDLAFIASTKSFSRWMEESDYGKKEQDKGFYPEYRLSNQPHLLSAGMTYKFDAGWYLTQPIPGAPATKKVLNQTLALKGTIDALHDNMNIKSLTLSQLVSAAIPMALGEKAFECEDLVPVE